jgi:hypothetical protein
VILLCICRPWAVIGVEAGLSFGLWTCISGQKRANDRRCVNTRSIVAVCLLSDQYEVKIAFPHDYPAKPPVVMLIRPVFSPYNGVRVDGALFFQTLFRSAAPCLQIVEGGCITDPMIRTPNVGVNSVLRLVSVLFEVDHCVTEVLAKNASLNSLQYPVAAFTTAYERVTQLPAMPQPLPLNTSTHFCKVVRCFGMLPFSSTRLCPRQIVQAFSANLASACGVRLSSRFEVRFLCCLCIRIFIEILNVVSASFQCGDQILMPESFLAELPVSGGGALTFEISVADQTRTNFRGLPFMRQRTFCGVHEFMEMPHDLALVRNEALSVRGSVHETIILPSWVR